MAGDVIELEIGENVSDALARFEAAAAAPTPAMGSIARLLVTETEFRFRTETAPDGVPWKKSLRVTGYTDRHGRKVPGDGGQTLTLHGDLRRSMKPDWGDDYAAAGPEASGGVAVYAEIHQRGGTIRPKRQADGTPHVLTRALNTPFGLLASVTIPARPYLGWNEQTENGVVEILDEYLQRSIDGRPPQAQP